MNEIYGAEGKVFLKYEGSLEEIGDVISNSMHIPKFYYETNQDKPYEKFGMCEVFGHELWLEKSSNTLEYDFILSFETSHSLEEKINNRMYDLSGWLARYLNDIHKLDVITQIDN